MVKRNRSSNNRGRPVVRKAPARPAETRIPLERYEDRQPSVPKRYGPPFVLLEDANKNTFEYQGGTWIPHSKKIAECQLDCLVKELPQKVNKMTRYEVRRLLPT